MPIPPCGQSPVERKMNQLRLDCEEVASLQALLKDCCRIYQFDAKQTVAKYYGLPFGEVDLPYLEWSALRERYQRDSGLGL